MPAALVNRFGFVSVLPLARAVRRALRSVGSAGGSIDGSSCPTGMMRDPVIDTSDSSFVPFVVRSLWP